MFVDKSSWYNFCELICGLWCWLRSCVKLIKNRNSGNILHQTVFPPIIGFIGPTSKSKTLHALSSLYLMWVAYVLYNRWSHGTSSQLLDITLSSKLDRKPYYWRCTNLFKCEFWRGLWLLTTFNLSNYLASCDIEIDQEKGRSFMPWTWNKLLMYE